MESLRADQSLAASFTYSLYDDAGNRLRMVVAGAGQTNGTTSYAYDHLHRLITEERPGEAAVHFAYDRAGDRSKSGAQDAGGGWIAPYIDYTYDEAVSVSHRLTAVTDDSDTTLHAFSYDANGNPTHWSGPTFARDLTWDALDRLVEIKSDIPGIFYASYVYDPLGRRIEKTEEGATTRYQYDGLDVVAEYDGSDADDPGGSDLATYAYDAFGKLTSPPPPFENTYTYTGRELDASGLYYYRARYYLPAAGRFLSPDPSGLAGGLNPYVYVSSNPVNFRDPFGLAAWGGTNDAATPLGGSSGLLDQKLGVASRIGVAGVGAAGAVGLGYGVGAILGATGCVASVVCGVAVGAVAVTAIGYDLYNGGASRIANSFSSFFNGDVTVRQALEVGALSSGLGSLTGFGARSLAGAGTRVASGGSGRIAEAQFVRSIARGERVKDLIREVAQRTYVSEGREHAIISLQSGERQIISGGVGGIDLGSVEGLRRVILHTHVESTGPSALDFQMLQALGQRSSYIYELFGGGGLSKFSRYR